MTKPWCRYEWKLMRVFVAKLSLSYSCSPLPPIPFLLDWYDFDCSCDPSAVFAWDLQVGVAADFPLRHHFRARTQTRRTLHRRFGSLCRQGRPSAGECIGWWRFVLAGVYDDCFIPWWGCAGLFPSFCTSSHGFLKMLSIVHYNE